MSLQSSLHFRAFPIVYSNTVISSVPALLDWDLLGGFVYFLESFAGRPVALLHAIFHMPSYAWIFFNRSHLPANLARLEDVTMGTVFKVSGHSMFA